MPRPHRINDADFANASLSERLYYIRAELGEHVVSCLTRMWAIGVIGLMVSGVVVYYIHVVESAFEETTRKLDRIEIAIQLNATRLTILETKAAAAREDRDYLYQYLGIKGPPPATK